MTTTYKFPTQDPDPMFKSNIAVIKLITGQNPIYIPKSEENTDYQEYLKWVSDGGVTQAAD